MSIEPPVIYVALDVERATGIENLFERYAIVTPWMSDLSKKLEAQRTRLFILERDCPNFSAAPEGAFKGGTYGMMKMACVKNFIKEFSRDVQPRILVLKNSELIEQECVKNEWKLLAPRAHTAKLFEDKITQWQLLHEVVQFPETVITDMMHAAEKAEIAGFPVVMQFNAGHSGGGTHIVASLRDIAPLKQNFPQRPVRMAKYISGPTYTLNAFVSNEGKVYAGSISKQLTGLSEATANPASTVGNDFGAAAKELSLEQGEVIAGMAEKIGRKMHEMDYTGLFGIDVIVEEETGTMYCIEVNTHQPASIPFEAKLHQTIKKTPLIFLWIRDMIEKRFSPSAEFLPPLFLRGRARQIIYRNKTDDVIPADAIVLPADAMRSRLKTVKPNEELFRIQSYDIIQ